jgi:branched-chain amino acid aminotransferase
MPVGEKHIIVNGEIISTSVSSLYHNNISFLYGDGLHEAMHAYGTDIQFADSHFQRLYSGLLALGIDIDENISQQKIIREIQRLLNRDKVFGGAKIILAVYRENKKHFTYMINYEQLNNDQYQISQKGLSLGTYKDIRKQFNILSAMSTNNMLLNVMADNYANTENLDEVLIMNDKGNIIESSHSNIFITKGNKIYTPSINEGCVEGIMREQIINLAKEAEFEVFSNCIITEKNVSEADEVLLSNAVDGIKWVLAFGQRRYYNKVAKILCDRLNKIAFR